MLYTDKNLAKAVSVNNSLIYAPDKGITGIEKIINVDRFVMNRFY